MKESFTFREVINTISDPTAQMVINELVKQRDHYKTAYFDLAEEYRDFFFTDEEKDFMFANNKIQAIKSVRERTGLSLPDAKKLVDHFMERNKEEVKDPLDQAQASLERIEGHIHAMKVPDHWSDIYYCNTALANEVLDLLHTNKPIRAIAAIRKYYNCSLKEGKALVIEAIRDGDFKTTDFAFPELKNRFNYIK